MNTLVTKSFQHLSNLLRIYSALALAGIFIALLYGVLSLFPKVAVWVLVVISFLVVLRTIILNRISRNRQRLARQHSFERDKLVDYLPFDRRRHDFPFPLFRPPARADYILYVLLPTDDSHSVLADLHDVYFKSRLKRRFGSKLHADLWYWKEVLRAVVPLLIWRLRSGFMDTSFPAEVREHIKDVLPFYRHTN